MDPTHRGPHEHGHDASDDAAGGSRRTPHRGPQPPAIGPHDRDRGGASSTPSPGIARTAQLTCGDYLLTVNPIDGSEIEQCPPGSPHRSAAPRRHTREERAELRRAQTVARSTVTAGPGAIAAGTAHRELPLLDREEERDRLIRLLTRGRSVRLTAPSGAGRSALLDAVADGCGNLAPDGVIRLSGYHRTPTDLLHALCAAVFRMPTHRPDRAELVELARDIGAVVIVDDIEFDGPTLDDFLDATPECAFLMSATPEVSAPSPGAYLEEVALGGLSRTACMELLGRLVRRPPTDEEAAWAADLWFESEGLPLRFVQAAALLRGRDQAAGRTTEPAADPTAEPAPGAAGADGGADAAPGAAPDSDADPVDAADATAPPRVPTLTEGVAPAALLADLVSAPARETLQYALALGGECPHPSHLPALIGDPGADAAVAELIGCGLVTPAGDHYRLVTGVAAQLTAAGFADDPTARALTVAQHYAWWAGHPSVAASRATEEADAILGALGALVAARGGAGARSAAQPPSAAGDGGGARVGQLSAAVLLARTAAPAFAAGLGWGAWERCLRYGQEAARLAGEVAEEAYFHHELGVLALCTGQLDRARAELEASISLRGVLADRRGAVAGRRALALVVDRTGISAPGGLDTLGELTGGEGGADAPAEGDAPGGGASPTDTTVIVPRQDATDTLPGPAVVPAAGGDAGTGGTRGGWRASVRKLPLLIGARRNAAAVGAGVLLVAVLGTVVTLGATSGGDGSPERVTPRHSTPLRDDGDEESAADEPRRDTGPGATGPGATTGPGTSGAPNPSASTGAGQSPSTQPSDGGPTTGGPSPTGDPTDGTPTDPSTRPTNPPTRPTDPPTRPTNPPTTRPTDPPTQPTDPPTEPTDPPSTAPTTVDPPQSPTQITSDPGSPSPTTDATNPRV
ncbi:ATP-binding protein [Streptomyces buecherae]|uniref:ATP-binding protein n=1 Tax=Streptomyces buecherae TaxID=2763006 RepID=UPI001C26274F|nr:ATP-binding protein [Streptomyces buecherae]